jgi:hypothetical protein
MGKGIKNRIVGTYRESKRSCEQNNNNKKNFTSGIKSMIPECGRYKNPVYKKESYKIKIIGDHRAVPTEEQVGVVCVPKYNTEHPHDL